MSKDNTITNFAGLETATIGLRSEEASIVQKRFAHIDTTQVSIVTNTHAKTGYNYRVQYWLHVNPATLI